MLCLWILTWNHLFAKMDSCQVPDNLTKKHYQVMDHSDIDSDFDYDIDSDFYFHLRCNPGLYFDIDYFDDAT